MASQLQPQPVYELAGQQDDPLVEEVLAVCFTDQPERASVRPGDSRAHQQWLVRSPAGASTRAWIGLADPITTASKQLLAERYQSALRVAFVPRYASSVVVTVTQTAVDELTMSWRLVRNDVVISSGEVVLPSGGS